MEADRLEALEKMATAVASPEEGEVKDEGSEAATFLTEESAVNPSEDTDLANVDSDEVKNNDRTQERLFHDFKAMAHALEGSVQLPRPHVTKEVIVTTLSVLNETSSSTAAMLNETRDVVAEMQRRQRELMSSSTMLRESVGRLDDSMTKAQNSLASHEDWMNNAAKLLGVDRLIEAVDKLTKANLRKDKQIAALQSLTEDQGARLQSLENTFLAQQQAAREKAQGGPVHDEHIVIKSHQVFVDDDKTQTLETVLNSLHTFNEHHTNSAESLRSSLTEHAEKHEALAGKHELVAVSSKLEATCTNLDELLHGFHQAGILEDKPKPIHHSEDGNVPPTIHKVSSFSPHLTKTPQPAEGQQKESMALSTPEELQAVAAAGRTGDINTTNEAEDNVKEPQLPIEKQTENIKVSIQQEEQVLEPSSSTPNNGAKSKVDATLVPSPSLNETKHDASLSSSHEEPKLSTTQCNMGERLSQEKGSMTKHSPVSPAPQSESSEAKTIEEAQIDAKAPSPAFAARESNDEAKISKAIPSEAASKTPAPAVEEEMGDSPTGLLVISSNDDEAALPSNTVSSNRIGANDASKKKETTPISTTVGNNYGETESATPPPLQTTNSASAIGTEDTKSSLTQVVGTPTMVEVNEAPVFRKNRTSSEPSTTDILVANQAMAKAKPMKLAGLITKMKKMGKFGVTNKLQVLEHRIDNELKKVQAAIEMINEKAHAIEGVVRGKANSGDIDVKIELKFDEVIDQLQAAISTAGSDEAEFKRAAKELQGTVNQLMSTKANKSELLAMKKRAMDESNIAEQLEELTAFVDEKLSREDAAGMLDEKVARQELDDRLKGMRERLKKVGAMASKLTKERARQPAWATGGTGKSLMCLSCSRQMSTAQIETLRSHDPSQMGVASLGPGGFSLGGGFQVRPATTPYKSRDESQSMVLNMSAGPQMFADRAVSSQTSQIPQPFPIPSSMKHASLHATAAPQQQPTQWSQGLLQPPVSAAEPLPPVTRGGNVRVPYGTGGAGGSGNYGRKEPSFREHMRNRPVPEVASTANGGLKPWMSDVGGVTQQHRQHRNLRGRPNSRDESPGGALAGRPQKPTHQDISCKKSGPTAARLPNSNLISQVKPKSHVLTL